MPRLFSCADRSDEVGSHLHAAGLRKPRLVRSCGMDVTSDLVSFWGFALF